MHFRCHSASYQLQVHSRTFLLTNVYAQNNFIFYSIHRWFIDDRVFSSGSEERFLNLKIENNMYNKLLKCEAKNQVSTQTASYQMDVTCKYFFLMFNRIFKVFKKI